MPEFRMPSLGADMEAGTLVAWHVAPGDAVHRGQVVADVETDKGLVEVEIWTDGAIDALVVKPGTKVPVGTVLATLHDGARAPATPAHAEQPPAPPSRLPVNPPEPSSRPMASPAARRRAGELGVALASLHGSGPHGAISVADVEAAAAPHAATEASGPVAKETPTPARNGGNDGMRRAIAAAMSRSKREIPHYYLSTTIDMTRALAWLRQRNANRPVAERLLPAALQIKAVALALGKHPALNGFWIDGGFTPGNGVHLGVAVSLRGGGLVAPAIRDTDTKELDTLMRAVLDVTSRVRGGALRSSELADATATLTMLGDLGVDSVFGVIQPPQVALVGIGRTADRPWAVDGLLGVRPVATLSLAADHRASDGHLGARFLTTLGELLQRPEDL